jgi:hypothetical protein
MNQQQPMLDGTDIETLPLFSGIPMPTDGSTFRAESAGRYEQPTFCKCRICRDTGMVSKKYCWCEAGVAARKMRGG